MVGQPPPAIHVRDAVFEDRFALARIILDATESAFRGLVPDHCLDGFPVEQSAANWGRSIAEGAAGEHLLVAEVEGVDVVALILAGRESSDVVLSADLARKYPSEITSLQVDPAWQRKGLGRLLIRHAAQRVIDGGAETLMVRVLKENPNIAFYEALGARILGSQPYVWEGYQTSEIIMGWDQIVRLIAR